MLRVWRLRTGFSVRSVVSVALILGLSGFLFATSARLARGDGGRQPEDLAQLLSSESDRADRLATQVHDLTKEIDGFGQESWTATSPNLSTAVGVAVGTIPVVGPGLTVSLTDAPLGLTYPDGEVPPANWLLVHQGDVQAVVNALWSGGAEAMTLQGQRVTPTTAFRCVGNTLLLHGRVFSPPYVIQAIGDPDALNSALEASSDVMKYRTYAERYGLGWIVARPERLDIPGYEDTLELTYARPMSEES